MSHLMGAADDSVSASGEEPKNLQDTSPKKIAVIGAGISGLGAAYYLHQHFDITVFEAADRIGGHTATVDVSAVNVSAVNVSAVNVTTVNETEKNEKSIAVDTGFIVFNDKTYPLFQGLMDSLGVAYQPTTMGFSFCEPSSGYEYSGESIKTLFAQRKNLLSLKHWRMLLDIIRFNRRAQQDLASGAIIPEVSLGDYLSQKNYGSYFTQRYLVPMAAAIWSKSYDSVMQMSALFFVRFFDHHGLLNIRQRPQWFVIKGGSREYLKALTKSFSNNIRTATPVVEVTRSNAGVLVSYETKNLDATEKNIKAEQFDHVIFACHSDQAEKILVDATSAEKSFLKSVPYRNNQVVLHTDISVLPKRRSLWASWNYFRPQNKLNETLSQSPATLTYDMNILQGFKEPETYCVTLNETQSLAEEKIIAQYEYAHPQFSIQSVEEQSRWAQVLKERELASPVNDTSGSSSQGFTSNPLFPANTWFCGAWCRNGFHEDGLNSAHQVAKVLLSYLPASKAESSKAETSKMQPPVSDVGLTQNAIVSQEQRI